MHLIPPQTARPCTLGLAAALVALAGCAAAGENDALDRHLDAAFETAWSAGHQPSPALPPGLAKLDYDDWRKIVFNREKKDWLNLQFRLEPFHRGFLHRELVRLYLIDPQGHLAERPYRPDDWFDHVPTKPEDRPADLGHPGIKIIADLNKPGVPDEVMSLIGGSYFRALGPGHAYGASCRVVALDPGGRETFPRFTALYLRQPAPGERFLDIGALVDSPEILARVRFRLVPGGNAGPSGNETIVETQVRVRARQTTPKIVLAPITSMFLHDQDWGRRLDFRPEIHDSDLLAWDDGSESWVQPLIQPPASRVEDIPAKAVTGFGLLQRDRRLENSLDLEALYHLRPSIWIEPRSSLPPGALRLLELHDEEEGHDNIGAGWLLSEPLQSGSETALRYDIRIRDDRPKPRVGILDRASAVPTRTGAAVVLRWTGVPDQGKRPWLRLTLAEGVAYRHAQVVPDGEGAWIASANIPDPRPGVWTAALVDDNQAALTEGWRFVWPRP